AVRTCRVFPFHQTGGRLYFNGANDRSFSDSRGGHHVGCRVFTSRDPNRVRGLAAHLPFAGLPEEERRLS
ncbi:MAG: hypothetical protein AAB433_15080, partial [Nitrospirota bacterium]